MKVIFRAGLTLATVSILAGCGTAQPPLDANGKTPEQVMMETYALIVDGHYDQARENFSADYLEEFVNTKNITFAEYCDPTDGWQREWLRTRLMGNDYNPDVWRVKIIPDEGKGKHNGPGVVQDLALVDGSWKIVFWGHYPKG